MKTRRATRGNKRKRIDQQIKPRVHEWTTTDYKILNLLIKTHPRPLLTNNNSSSSNYNNNNNSNNKKQQFKWKLMTVNGNHAIQLKMANYRSRAFPSPVYLCLCLCVCVCVCVWKIMCTKFYQTKPLIKSN